MTYLYDKWNLYCKNFPSPQSWIDFGFWFLISSALQRRVWYYESQGIPLYCNQYTLFIGPPGSGKGLVLGEVAKFLKYHRYERGQMVKTSVGAEFPPLFPVGADSITFEELLVDLANSTRRIDTGEKVPYVHCSYVFVLEELSSLFKRKTEDVIKFLLNAYDCKDYDYKTKHQGKELLRRLCLSLIAGTQVDFLKEASDARLFGQGFASRTLFLFESGPRFHNFHISDFTPEQLQAKTHILSWLKKLSEIYGQIRYSQETANWLDYWYATEHAKKAAKASFKMQDYYARKKVTMLKIAAAMHFAESLEMEIELPTFQRAIDALDAIEPSIEAGLALGGRNPLAVHMRRILGFIKVQQQVPFRDIILEFGAELEMEEIDSCLKMLEIAYGIKVTVLQDGQKVYSFG